MHHHRAPRPRPLPARLLRLLLLLPLLAACGTAPASPPTAPPGTALRPAAGTPPTPLPAAAGTAVAPLPGGTGGQIAPVPGVGGVPDAPLPPPQGTFPLPPPPSPTDTGCPSGAPTFSPFRRVPGFNAQLTFAPPLPAAEFTRLVCDSGLAVDQISVQAAAGLSNWEGEAGAADTAHLLHLLATWPAPDPRVALATIRTDAEQYRRLLADPRIHGDTGVDGVPTGGSADAVNAWFVAADAIHTLHGRQTLRLLYADGTPLAGPPDARWPSQTDEVSDSAGVPSRRYRVTAQFPAGPVTTSWDGTHAQRYFPWLGEVEVYPPEIETPDQYWWHDLDADALSGLLRPARFDYNLAGPTTVDGRAAVGLVLPGGTGVVPGRAPTRVDLDAATSLPLRLVTDTGVPAPDRPGTLRLERTFVDIRINAPVPAADLAIPLAPDTLVVEHPVAMASALAAYGTWAEAARAAGVPLYAPAGGATGPLSAPVFITRAGRRTAVIALDAAGLLEGAALPALDTPYPPAPPGPPAPVQALTIAGHPATLQGGILRVTLGATQVQISGVPDAATAAARVAALTPVP